MAQPGVSGRQIQLVAIGFAIAALVTALIAVIVVVRRADSTPAQDRPGLTERRIAANELVKLKRDAVEMVVEAGDNKGVRVIDAGLRGAFGLDEGDVITAISGRQIKRQYDVQDALFGVSMLNATTIYIDVIHDHHPEVQRWLVDGDLTKARRSAVDAALGKYSLGSGGTASANNSGGLLSPVTPPDPDPVLDALVGSINKIDDTHVEVPRSSVDKVLTNPMAVAKGARIVPAIRNGQPDGFKLYAVRPNSIFAALGFNNGDTIQAVNGLELRDASTSLDVYTKLRDSKELKIDMLRRGTPMTLTITVK